MYLENFKSLKRSNQFKNVLYERGHNRKIFMKCLHTITSVKTGRKKKVNTFTSFIMMQVLLKRMSK